MSDDNQQAQESAKREIEWMRYFVGLDTADDEAATAFLWDLEMQEREAELDAAILKDMKEHQND